MHYKDSRSRVLLLGLLVIGGIFIVRLFWLQVIKHDYYVAEALKEQVTKFTLPAERGLIYARDGDKVVPLVLNEPVYEAYADPKEVKDAAKILEVMRRVAGGNLLDISKQLDDSDRRYVVMAKNLSKRQAELIKREELAGLGFKQTERRVYPEGQLASQLLGYVNADNQGQYGLEGALQKRLAGIPGELKAVTDVRRIPLTVGNDDVSTPAKPGENVVLNIDRNIQSYVENALKTGLKNARATEGSVVVMDPRNGHVLAMANHPTYNPAKYNEVKDYSLFQNKIVTDPYEAGSVMKTLTMGVGLDSGAVTPATTYNNTGYIQVDDRTIRNVEEDPINPHATMTDVLHYSLNTGVVFILQQMGDGQVNQEARNKLYDYFFKHYLLGQLTKIEQAGEQAGTIIPPTQAEGNNVRYSNMVFGQGMDVTMLQVAGALAAAVNGGTYYQPQLVGGILKEDGEITKKAPHIVRQNVLKPQTSVILRNMIVEARRLGVFKGQDRPGFMVGGKTGTSQRIDAATGRYTDDNSIGSYLGFGGGKTPQYVIMVRVNDSKIPGYAGTTAAGPVFTDISNWMIDYLDIQPS